MAVIEELDDVPQQQQQQRAKPAFAGAPHGTMMVGASQNLPARKPQKPENDDEDEVHQVQTPAGQLPAHLDTPPSPRAPTTPHGSIIIQQEPAQSTHLEPPKQPKSPQSPSSSIIIHQEPPKKPKSPQPPSNSIIIHQEPPKRPESPAYSVHIDREPEEIHEKTKNTGGEIQLNSMHEAKIPEQKLNKPNSAVVKAEPKKPNNVTLYPVTYEPVYTPQDQSQKKQSNKGESAKNCCQDVCLCCVGSVGWVFTCIASILCCCCQTRRVEQRYTTAVTTTQSTTINGYTQTTSSTTYY